MLWWRTLSLSARHAPEEQENSQVKLTSVCLKSILANGLSSVSYCEAEPFVSFGGLSGGGVAVCCIGLKLLRLRQF